MAIKYQKKKPTLRTLHEQDNSNFRKARHNKSMVDLTTLPVSLAFFAIGLIVLYIASQTKGRLKATAEKIRLLTKNLVIGISAGQTMRQMYLWTFLGPFYTFGTQVYLFATNSQMRTHFKRAIYS